MQVSCVHDVKAKCPVTHALLLSAGTDEHGEKIAEAAAGKGQQPQEHCDGIVGAFKALWEEVLIRISSSG